MISSHFIDGPAAYLSARSVPPVKDNDRSIAIGVVSMPACRTDKRRLALAASAVDCPAGRAGLRTISRVDLCEGCAFVGEHRLDLMPADIEDGSVQPAFLSDTFEAATSSHVFGSQAFDDDVAVPGSDVSCCFVRPIFASAGLSGFQDGDTAAGFCVASRSPLLSRELFAGQPVALLQSPDIVWQRVACAIAEHHRYGNASIDADDLAIVDDLGICLTAKADLPTKRRQDNGSLCNRSLNVTVPTKLDPTYLGQANTRPALVDPIDLNFAPNVTKCFVDAFLFPPWKSTLSRKETAERRIKILKRALLSGLTNSANPIELRPKRSQLFGLRNVVQIVAGAGLVVPPVIDALLKRSIPNRAAYRRDLKHLLRLLFGRAKAIAVTTENHIKLLAYSPYSFNSNKGRAFLPALKDGVFGAGEIR